MDKKQAAEQRLAIVRAYRTVFYDDAGQLKPEAAAVMADLENECFGLRTTVVKDGAGAVDPNATLRNEGKRAVFLHIRQRQSDVIRDLKRAAEDTTRNG